jgi:hypothetical protein
MAHKKPARDDLIKDINRVQVSVHGKESEKIISRDRYLKHGKFSKRQWNAVFGTFQEFRRQAGIKPRRQIDKIERDIGKHASIDHLKKLNAERKEWGERYLRENSNRYQLIIGSADWHDIESDPFMLRVFLDTLHRAQPDVISFAGDIYGHSEFGKYHVDPRDWDPVRRMRFVNCDILGESRSRCPNAQIDIVEGNHERRLLKHLTSNSPAAMVFLSDWLGLTIKDMLKLEDLEINYVAEADMTAWTKQAEAKELAKNFRIYFDCVLVHHYTNLGKAMGYPGFSGHNHKHMAYADYSPQFGSYEWHQIGCGCARNANYTEGLKWGNGFILVHVDVKNRVPNFEYIPVTDHACVGGKMYYRERKEIVTPGRK